MSKQLIFLTRLTLFATALTGVVLEFEKGGTPMALYYTVLSNILVTAFMAYLLYLMARGDQAWKSQTLFRQKAGVTMAIMITCVIYHIMLRPIATAADFYRLDNFLCHYIVPLWFLADTLFLDGQKQYKRLDPVLWALVPLVYSIFSIFNGLVLKMPIPTSKESPFPYFFLNGPRIGWDKVAIYVLVIFFAYMISGYVFYGLKSLSFGKRKN